jgi:hypothetical protein
MLSELQRRIVLAMPGDSKLDAIEGDDHRSGADRRGAQICSVAVADALVAPPRWSRRDLVERELESVVLARLGSAPLADAVPAVDGRDVEPGHRGVAVVYFTEVLGRGMRGGPIGRESVERRLQRDDAKT